MFHFKERLNRWRERLRDKEAEISSSETKSDYFDDLAPVDDADKEKNYQFYAKALAHALKKDKIKNIAITGPYGSGKSSIINTFEQKNSELNFLKISLASFDERTNSSRTPFTTAVATTTENRLIERSILQQMLYGVDADKLRYSRFKRILIPKAALARSFIICMWLLTIIFLFTDTSFFEKIDTFSFSHMVATCLITFVIVVPIILGALVYESFFGISFKKLSLKNAEFEINSLSEDSILNRHLDEIIYFFQVTNYHAVIFEDLDRFGSPEIFVKLREINNLINKNDKTDNKIKFIYALKDDMFANEDRAKFFEFIIPVVPIIDNSNSLDIMHNRLEYMGLLSVIKTEFLRDVSFFINDMRLLKNIFNEFIIYAAQISVELNKTQLLAMMIYKNLYPDDFEKLHNSDGALFRISESKNTIIEQLKNKISNDIDSLQLALKHAREQSFLHIEELIKLFLGQLFLSTSDQTNLKGSIGVFINSESVEFSELLNWEIFEQLIAESDITFAVPHPQNRNHLIPRASGKSFKDIENEINTEVSFLERKLRIDNLKDDSQKELRAEIRALESEKNKIAVMPLHELIKKTDISVDEILSEYNLPAPDLFRYLVTEGYLNENYPLYISTFHEGRISMRDRSFVLAIRSYRETDPLQIIDNPEEVCVSLRTTDFSQHYILNVVLMDYLLQNSTSVTNQLKLDAVLDFISRNFETARDFLITYFEYGKNIELITQKMASYWPSYAIESLKFSDAPTHIANILSFVDEKQIVNVLDRAGKLSEYISMNGGLIFNSEINFNGDYSILKQLKIKFQNLNSLKENILLLEYIHNENLYQINSNNLRVVLGVFCHAKEVDISTANLSTVLELGTESLKSYVKQNLQTYIDTVFLLEPDNTLEKQKTINFLVDNETISLETKKKVLKKQEYKFNSLEDIPQNLWDFALTEGQVDITWKNISTYLFYSDNKQEIEAASEFITALFLRTKLADELKDTPIDSTELGDGISKKLSRFIVNNDALLKVDYENLIQCLPYRYRNFPNEISADKAFLLAKHDKISLNSVTFEYSKNDKSLLSMLIAKNKPYFIANRKFYEISDAVIENILKMDEFGKIFKLKLFSDIQPTTLEGNHQLANISVDLLSLPAANHEKYSNELLKSVITNTEHIKKAILLLSKNILRFDKSEVIDILKVLPEPYKDIASFGKQPKLDKNKENLHLIQELEKNNIISSKKVRKGVIEVYTYKKPF